MILWNRVVATLYDRMLADSERAGLSDRRGALLAATYGSVIEIGAGTGLNLAHYPDSVRELVLLEPETAMANRLERRIASSSLPLRLVRAPAEKIPVADATFDFAVSTLVLCSVRDPQRALRELRRVLKPDGRLLFLEHVRAAERGSARQQDWIDPLWSRVGCGCHCNRDTLQAIAGAGFSVQELERGRIPKAAGFVSPMIEGSALIGRR